MRSTTRRRLARCASVHAIQAGGTITLNLVDRDAPLTVEDVRRIRNFFARDDRSVMRVLPAGAH